MANQCSIVQEALDKIADDDQLAYSQAEAEIESVINPGPVEAALNKIDVWFRDEQRKLDKLELSPKLFRKKFKELYDGPDKEKAMWSALLMGTMKGNAIRRAVMLKRIFNEALYLQEKGQIKLNKPQDRAQQGTIDIMSLPISTVKKLYWQSWNWSKSTGTFDSVIGRFFVVPMTRPKNLQYRDESGGYSVMEGSVSNILSRVYMHVNRFMHGYPEGANRRTEGMHDIINQVGSIGEKVRGHGYEINDAQKYFTDFFQMLGTGWIRQNTEGTGWEIASKYSQKTAGGKGAEKKLDKWADGTTKWGWQGFIPLERFNQEKHGNLNPKVQEFLERHIDMSPEVHKEMYGLMLKAKAIHKEVFEYLNGREVIYDSKKHGEVPSERLVLMTGPGTSQKRPTFKYKEKIGQFEQSKDLLIKELNNWFKKPPNIKDNDWRQLIYEAVFENKTKGVPPQVLKSIKQLEPFTQYNIFETMFMDTNEIGKHVMGENPSLPIQYNMYLLPQQMDMALSFQREELKAEEAEKNATQNANKKRELKAKIKARQFGIKKMEDTLARIEGQPSDSQNGHKMVTRRDLKHAKHITNAYNPMLMRTDTNVYNAYLRNNFFTVERNRMTAQLLSALRIAKEPAVKEAIISLYKGTMQDPGARTKMPFTGMDVSPENVARYINKLPWNIPADKIDRVTQWINKYVAGRYLSGWSTALINNSQSIQKLIEVGRRRKKRVDDYYEAHKDDSGLKRLIENSGVAEFKDYFSAALIGEMDALEEGRDLAYILLGAMEKYQRTVKKNPGDAAAESKAFDKYLEMANKILASTTDSKYFAIKREHILQGEQLKNRSSAFRNRAIGESMNKFANYAINKEYKAKRTGKLLFNNVIANTLKSGGEAWAHIYKRTFGLKTLADTEQTLRSKSFLIGAFSYLDLMNLQISPHELIDKLSDPDEGVRAEWGKHYQNVLQAGRLFTREFDFDLEAPLYGEANRTPIGRLLLRFSTWGQQKFGKDASTIYNAYLTNKESHSLGGKTAAIAKTLKQSIFTKQSTLRATNRDVAALRAYYYQAIGTLLFDVFIINPLVLKTATGIASAIPVSGAVSKIMRKLPGINTVRGLGGFTSDLASVFWMPWVMLLKYGLRGDEIDEPEEEIKEDLYYYMRRFPIMGVGTTVMIDHMLAFLAMVDEDNDPEQISDAVGKATDIYVPTKTLETAKDIVLDQFMKDR